MPDQDFGSDGQLHDTAAQPLAGLGILAAPGPAAQSVYIFAASEPASAAQRLRAFEDEHIGPDAVRLHGDRVERGSGSLFQRLPADKRYAHALIEKTVETEQKLAKAHTALLAAEAEHEAALAAAADVSRFGG